MINTKNYPALLIKRFKNIIYNDSSLMYKEGVFSYRSGGCNTRLKLEYKHTTLLHCTSADIHGNVTSDCICEFINNNKPTKEIVLSYINNVFTDTITNTDLDSIIFLPEKPRSVWLIINYYKQHINSNDYIY